MKKRLPPDENGIVVKLNVLDTNIAFDLSRSPESIAPSAIHFPHVILQNKLNELNNQ